MIKGILFDKDGTLVDFFSLWLGAAEEVTGEFLRKNSMPEDREMREYIMEAMGIKNNKADPKGGLAYKSYAEIAKDLEKALSKKNISISVREIGAQLEGVFTQYISGDDVCYIETADLKVLLEKLKRMEIYIGLATADTLYSALKCLESLNILAEFDYIGADDGVKRPKPYSDMFQEFQEKFSLKPEEIAVVGDTCNDMVFARQNGGIGIGVLSGVSEREDFGKEADYILASVEGLPAFLKELQNRQEE